MTGAPTKLSVAALNAAYGRAHVLYDVALTVGAGEAVALIGRNGAGKSTTMRSIVGLVANCSGEIIFDGMPIARFPAHERVRRGLGYVPEDRRIFSELTVDENLSVGRQGPPKALQAHGCAAEPGRDLLPLADELSELGVLGRRGGHIGVGDWNAAGSL